MTREKVLKIITDWVEEPQPRCRIMWLNGPAGAGKTAIAQTIAERCSEEQLAASFFFLRNCSDRGTATRLFTTLAWQLAKNIPEILSYIELAIRTEPLLPTKSINIQFDRLIVKIFEDRPDLCPKKSLIIIDGVDECAPEETQKLVLELVGSALAKSNIPLRFLICSRAEAHIQETLERGNLRDVTHSLVLDHRFAPQDDIRRYLESEFTRISNQRNISSPGPSSWPPNGAVEMLVAKSSGQFIHASTVIQFVDDKDGNPREQLDIVLKLRSASCSWRSPPFAELDQLYIQILSQQRDIRFLRDLFALILGLRQPEVSFVCRRLRISEEELKRRLRRMQSVIRISGSVIESHHLSLHDFLQDRKRAGRFFVHPTRVMFVRLPEILRPVLVTSAAVVGIVPFAVLTLGAGPLYFLTRAATPGRVTSKADTLYAYVLVHSQLV